MSEESALQAQQRSDMAIGPHGLMPRTISELARLATALVRGGIAPKGMTAEAAIGVMLAGVEVGFGPIQSLQSIAFINGRPTIYGDGVSALLWRSGKLERLEEKFEGTGEDLAAVCTMRRRGNPNPVERRFSWRDAKTAGLSGRDTWKACPKRMLRWRAFSWAARDLFSDVLKGIWIREEAEDLPQPEAMPAPREIESVEVAAPEVLPLPMPAAVASVSAPASIPVVVPEPEPAQPSMEQVLSELAKLAPMPRPAAAEEPLSGEAQ